MLAGSGENQEADLIVNQLNFIQTRSLQARLPCYSHWRGGNIGIGAWVQREESVAAIGSEHFAAAITRNTPTLSRPRNAPNLLKRCCVELESYIVPPRHHYTYSSTGSKTALAEPAAIRNLPGLHNCTISHAQTANRRLSPHASAFNEVLTILVIVEQTLPAIRVKSGGMQLRG